MFSIRLVKICCIALQLSKPFSTFALTSNAHKNQFLPRPVGFSIVRNALFYSVVFIYWIYRAVEAKYLGNKSEFHNICIYILTGFFTFGSWVLFLFNAKKTVAILNSFLLWARKFQETWMPDWNYNTSLTGKLFENFICIFGITIIVFCQILVLFQHIIFPELKCFLFNAVPAGYQNRWTLVVSVMLDQIHGFMFSISISALGLPVLGYLCAMVPLIMKEFRPNLINKKYKTSNLLRKPFNLIYAYRGVEIMHGMAMDLIGKLILPYYTLGGQFILFCNVSALREESVDVTLIIYSVLAQVVAFIALEFSGRFSKNAIATVKSWKYLKCSEFERKCLNKFRHSCIPLRIETRGYFVIRRLTVIKFLRAVVRGTFRALMALNQGRKG